MTQSLFHLVPTLYVMGREIGHVVELHCQTTMESLVLLEDMVPAISRRDQMTLRQLDGMMGRLYCSQNPLCTPFLMFLQSIADSSPGCS